MALLCLQLVPSGSKKKKGQALNAAHLHSAKTWMVSSWELWNWSGVPGRYFYIVRGGEKIWIQAAQFGFTSLTPLLLFPEWSINTLVSRCGFLLWRIKTTPLEKGEFWSQPALALWLPYTPELLNSWLPASPPALYLPLTAHLWPTSIHLTNWIPRMQRDSAPGSQSSEHTASYRVPSILHTV